MREWSRCPDDHAAPLPSGTPLLVALLSHPRARSRPGPNATKAPRCFGRPHLSSPEAGTPLPRLALRVTPTPRARASPVPRTVPSPIAAAPPQGASPPRNVTVRAPEPSHTGSGRPARAGIARNVTVSQPRPSHSAPRRRLRAACQQEMSARVPFQLQSLAGQKRG